MNKRIATLFAVCSMGLTLCSCGETSKVLDSIEAKGYKTEYYVDEPYDPIGLKVTANYTNGETKQLKGTEYTVTGFDSSVVNAALPLTVSYTEGEITKTTSFTVSIIPQEEETKVTLNFSVNVSGISEYTGGHSLIYINSSIEKDDNGGWTTKVLTQDEGNPNLWTVSFDDVLADQIYSLNFYYGGNGGADWTYGKNLLESTDKDACLTFEVNASDAVSGVVSHTFDASFSVPDFDTITVNYIVTPLIKTSADAEGVAINDGVNVFAWTNGEAEDKTSGGIVKFEKGQDGTWSHSFTVSLNKATGKGSIQCTFALGKTSVNWSYQMGAYNATTGKWETWNGENLEVSLEQPTVTYTAYFKGQPA